jgi:membrane-associated phospholipid phosphatase
MRRLFALAVAGGVLTTTATAKSDEPGLVWNPAWPRVHWSEYATAGTLFVVGTFGGLVVPQRIDGWTSDFLFDKSFQKRASIRSRATRDTAVLVGDVFFYGLWAYPAIVDVGVAAMAVHRSWDVAWQMFWIDLQAYSITGTASLLTQKLIGRRRPYVDRCLDNPYYDADCDEPETGAQSFISGHVSIAFTGAGLMCAHHAHLDLYGGGWPDVLACSLSLLGASISGGARLVADRHYVSDIVVGSLVGLASGYLMPELIHYKFGLNDEPDVPKAAATILPMASADALGLQLVGYH